MKFVTAIFVILLNNSQIMRRDENRFTSIQNAEEMIKLEMLCMLHYDAINNQTACQRGFNSCGQKVSLLFTIIIFLFHSITPI